MNPPDHDPSLTDLPGADTPGDAEAAAKPKRKRTVRKTDAADAAPAAAEAVAPAAVPAEVEAAAPAKPKRTRRKVSDDAPADAAGAAAEPVSVMPASQTEAAPAEEAAPKRRRRAAAAAPSDSTAVAPEAPPAAAPVAQAALASDTPPPAAAQAEPRPAVQAERGGDGDDDVGADDADDAGGEQGADGAAPADGEAPRRNKRNRRRGRRGGDRAAREGEAVADSGEPVQVVTVSAQPGDDDDEEGARAAPATPADRVTPVDSGEAFAAVLSGDYDADAADVAPVPDPDKRVLAAEPDAPKLHKVLAQAGIGSRRDMEQLIADGQVQVNGQVAHTGQRISFGDRISVGGKQIKVRIAPLPARVLAYHKPVGEVVTHDDPQHRPTVFRRLPRLPQGKWQSVGRLDINTEGLLLFTNSGELANQLMHPRFGVEREYAVRVLGTLTPESKAKLLDGVEIEGQRAQFKSIDDGGGEGVNHWYRVVITEGRNREVRKLFDKVGLGVSRLIRIRYGGVVLPRGLKRGVWVDLSGLEVGELRRMAGGGPREPRDLREGQGGEPGQRPPRQDRGPRDGQGGGKRNDRGDRADRGDRRGPPPNGPRGDRPERPPQGGGQAVPRERKERDRESDEFARIPNPLMQTFDKRAIREARAPRREYSEDGPIPNPLEQTYDKRFVQKDRGLGGGGGRKGGGGGGGQGGQPDPLKTAVGYIGADAFVRKFQGNGGGGGGGGGGGNRGGRRRGGR